MSGRGDDALWRNEEAARLVEKEEKNAMLRRELEKFKARIRGLEPEKLPQMNGPLGPSDVTVVGPKEGVKFDSGKLRMDLLPTDAIEALARVMTDGATKYGNRNWESGMAWSRPYAALLRHLLAWWGGQDKDPESGHSHLWHVLTNAAFLTAYERRGIGEDDRPAMRLVMGEVEG